MLGKAFLPYLEGMNSTQLHLVTIYANRILQVRTEITAFSDRYEDFKKLNTKILGVSVDSVVGLCEEQHAEDDQLVQDHVQMTDSATPTPPLQQLNILKHKNNQPVGPKDEAVSELSSFLGTLARKATLCPLDIFDRRHMDTKQELWDYTKAKYDIPDAAKHWILERIRESWRKNKSDLKRDHYDPWENDEIQLKKRPKSVPECQFKELLVYWKSEKFQAQIKEIETQLGSNEQSVDAFSAVMRAEHLGHVRLLGGGVKKTSLKRLNDRSGPTLNATNDVVPQMQERMRKIEDQIEEQKRTIRQEVVADVITQLQYAGIIDPKILAALSIPSPMGSTSTLAATERNNQNRKGDHDVEDGGNEIDELDLT
ncbi:putative dolichyl-diphosphooligosaccharide--protein glycosyltransferase subunit 4B-like [Capsicum annuum]|nr:putative dolichyl-diphosphooligosaccharide--protein glycosyltransferase subunit 4B-like [Capsicum annuum]